MEVAARAAVAESRTLELGDAVAHALNSGRLDYPAPQDDPGQLPTATPPTPIPEQPARRTTRRRRPRFAPRPPRRTDQELIEQARAVAAELTAQGREVTAQALRERMRIGAASARALRDEGAVGRHVGDHR